MDRWEKIFRGIFFSFKITSLKSSIEKKQINLIISWVENLRRGLGDVSGSWTLSHRSAGETGGPLHSCACVGLLEVTWDCHVFLKITILRSTLGWYYCGSAFLTGPLVPRGEMESSSHLGSRRKYTHIELGLWPWLWTDWIPAPSPAWSSLFWGHESHSPELAEWSEHSCVCLPWPPSLDPRGPGFHSTQAWEAG